LRSEPSLAAQRPRCTEALAVERPKAIHEAVNEGDLLQISPPKNHFPLTHIAKKSLLLAGGTSVTPILCMAERLGALPGHSISPGTMTGFPSSAGALPCRICAKSRMRSISQPGEPSRVVSIR
jgi:hypothetical protein